MEIGIIDKSSVPPFKAKNPAIEKIVAALFSLTSEQAIKVDLGDEIKVKQLQSNLQYYRTKRRRPGQPTFPNLKTTRRGGILFCWLEEEGKNE